MFFFKISVHHRTGGLEIAEQARLLAQSLDTDLDGGGYIQAILNLSTEDKVKFELLVEAAETFEIEIINIERKLLEYEK